jgi:phosphoribosylformimino-5-aminoimidazole carboxamide ribotide isomerase
MIVIPAIDTIQGKCVRLTQGNYSSQKIYDSDPLEVAKKFEDYGCEFLHLVDLDGAKQGKVVNYEILQKICQKTNLQVDFGGGIKTEDDLKKVFDSGAKQVNLGSIAYHEPDKVVNWISRYGNDKIILSCDVKEENEGQSLADDLNNYKIAVSGWQSTTKEGLYDFINYYSNYNLSYVTCTDISRDGTLSSPNLNLYRQLNKAFPEIKITASGGVRNIQDFEKLKKEGIYGVITGKAIYEKKISMRELSSWLKTDFSNTQL